MRLPSEKHGQISFMKVKIDYVIDHIEYEVTSNDPSLPGIHSLEDYSKVRILNLSFIYPSVYHNMK